MPQPHDSGDQVTSKSSTRRILERILALVFIVLIVGLAIWLSWKMVQGIFSAKVLSALVAGVITIVGSAATIAYGKIQEKKKDIEQQLRVKKIPVYENFLQLCFRCMAAVKDGEVSESKAPLDSEFRDFIQTMIVWASDDVMLAFSKWLQICRSPSDSETGALEKAVALEQLLLVIRKDLGHENKNLGQGDILRLIVNDLDQHAALEEENTE